MHSGMEPSAPIKVASLRNVSLILSGSFQKVLEEVDFVSAHGRNYMLGDSGAAHVGLFRTEGRVACSREHADHAARNVLRGVAARDHKSCAACRVHSACHFFGNHEELSGLFLPDGCLKSVLFYTQSLTWVSLSFRACK